ncbi:MAG: hypothetical protein R3Y54_11535 [Eubacteriales bacterium]
MDIIALLKEATWEGYEEYPSYLYDDYIWNDVSYVLDKTTMYQGVINSCIRTLSGLESATFDEYSYFEHDLGYEAVVGGNIITPLEENPLQRELTKEECEIVMDTIEKNFIEVIESNLDTEFYIFYSPYSIRYWELCRLEGTLSVYFQAMLVATEMLLQYDNVKLYYFFDQHDIIMNYDYYSDVTHYSPEINTKMLQWLSDDMGLLTLDNYEDIMKSDQKFYSEVDYVNLYRE